MLIALGLAEVVEPGVGLDLSAVIMADTSSASAEVSMADTLVNIIPTNIIAAMNSGAMLQIIFFALVLGFVLGRLGKKVETVNRFFTQFNTVMMTMINLVLKVAPVGIFCLIVRTFANLGIDGMLPMLKFILTVYGGLFLQLFVVYLILFVLFTRLNPLRFLRKILPVMLFAFSTSSSNATIPLNLETLERKCGVDEKVAEGGVRLSTDGERPRRRHQQGGLFRSIHGHLVLLLFRCLPQGRQLLKGPLFKICGEVHGVKGGTVISAIHSTSSFKIWRSRSRPRESRVPTVGTGSRSRLAISLME